MRNGKNLVIRVDRESAFDDRTGIQFGAADSDRGICFSEKRDVVIVHPDDAFCVDFLQSHYVKLGLDVGRVIVGDGYDVAEGIGRNFNVMPFLFDDKAHQFRPNARRLAITQKMRSKNGFIEVCRQLNLPIPQTYTFDSVADLNDTKKINFPCWFKPDLGFTGRGVEKFNDSTELNNHIMSLENDAPFQVQSHLDQAETFINVGYYAHDGEFTRLLATDQILGGKTREEHMGNIYDPDNDFFGVWQQTDKLAQYMADEGMEGIFAFDVAVCRSLLGQPYYVMIECNPRPNGSSFPTRLVSRLTGSLDKTPWMAESLSTSVTSLQDLDLGDYMFNTETGVGAVVHIASTLKRGRLGLTFIAPTIEQVRLLRNEVAEFLA